MIPAIFSNSSRQLTNPNWKVNQVVVYRRRRYLGYYFDRMAMEIRRGETKMAPISTGVAWDTLWEIRA